MPQGWWHYEVATVDCTHLLAIFNAPVPEVILGSDLLTITPANVLAHTYCLNEAKVKDTLAPVKPGTFIGPPADCCEPGKAEGANAAHANNMAPYTYPQAPQPLQPFGYQPAPVHGYYGQPYVQQYHGQPYVQPYPGLQTAAGPAGNV
ncbi:hypothetical protein D3C75_1053570 [compost metagenome]